MGAYANGVFDRWFFETKRLPADADIFSASINEVEP